MVTVRTHRPQISWSFGGARIFASALDEKQLGHAQIQVLKENRTEQDPPSNDIWGTKPLIYT